MKNLEGDSPVVFGVLCQVDGGHSAAAELAIDGIQARESTFQSLDWEDRRNGRPPEKGDVNMASPTPPVKLRVGLIRGTTDAGRFADARSGLVTAGVTSTSSG